MIPGTNGFLSQDFEITQQPSKTYQMNMQLLNIRGFAKEQLAMAQLIYKILNTERYQYVIYSWNYGVELLDLFGEPVSYVCPELKRRITEALTQDSRIQSVDAFDFEVEKGKVHVTFTAHTIFGDIPAEKVVNI